MVHPFNKNVKPIAVSLLSESKIKLLLKHKIYFSSPISMYTDIIGSIDITIKYCAYFNRNIKFITYQFYI